MLRILIFLICSVYPYYSIAQDSILVSCIIAEEYNLLATPEISVFYQDSCQKKQDMSRYVIKNGIYYSLKIPKISSKYYIYVTAKGYNIDSAIINIDTSKIITEHYPWIYPFGVVMTSFEEVFSIQFKKNETTLSKNNIPILQNLTRFIKERLCSPTYKNNILVIGHCSKNENDIIALKRSKNTYQYLIDNGIEAECLSYMVLDTTWVHQQNEGLNRIVEFEIVEETSLTKYLKYLPFKKVIFKINQAIENITPICPTNYQEGIKSSRFLFRNQNYYVFEILEGYCTEVVITLKGKNYYYILNKSLKDEIIDLTIY